MKGGREINISNFLECYKDLYQRRALAPNTYKMRNGQFAVIEEKIGGLILAQITTRHIAEFLESWQSQGKNSQASKMRSLLSDIFREAIAEGHIQNNPVSATRTATVKVRRERLDLAQYKIIRQAADVMAPWFALFMDLALITGQRREDIAALKFSNILEDRRLVTQGKTGPQCQDSCHPL